VTGAFQKGFEKERTIVFALCHLICRVDAGSPVEQQPDDVDVAILRCLYEARPSVLGRRQHKRRAGGRVAEQTHSPSWAVEMCIEVDGCIPERLWEGENTLWYLYLYPHQSIP
jgi:hypothetical protein